MNQTQERRYRVIGMTCEHCRAAVAETVREVPGVDMVDVDLSGGLVTVRGVGVDEAAVRAAVDEAGYEVAS